jgi:hypothetical protein
MLISCEEEKCEGARPMGPRQSTDVGVHHSENLHSSFFFYFLKHTTSKFDNTKIMGLKHHNDISTRCLDVVVSFRCSGRERRHGGPEEQGSELGGFSPTAFHILQQVGSGLFEAFGVE